MQHISQDWDLEFAPQILERGLDYFERGLVRDLQICGGTVTATVCGGEDYEVELEFVDDELAAVFCSCPYAEKDLNCKHMAAVCFALSEALPEKPEAAAYGSVCPPPIEQLIASLSEAQAKDLLLTLASGSEALRNRIRTLVTGKFTP